MRYGHLVPIRSRMLRYAAAVLLAVAAQVARIPLHPPTIVPFITYAPFVVVSALLGGMGPGILSTFLCIFEIIYFAIEPIGSLTIADQTNWHGIGAFAVTGVAASLLAERLKRSREQLSKAHHGTLTLLESISDGFTALDREWSYTYVNPAAARMLGKTLEELLGKNLWELWPHAADSPLGAAYRRAVAEGVPVQVEAFYPEPLNAWFEVRCYPSPDGLSVFFTDTTERKRAEERTRLLESAMLQTHDGVLILAVSGRDVCCQTPIFANAAFEKMTGFRMADMQRGALPLLYGSRSNVHAREHQIESFREHCPTRLEQPVRRKDGSEFSAEWSFRPLAGADGHFTHCVWTCRDITERKQAEEKALLFGSIVKSSDDAIISKNLDGIILSWNRGAERIYGYTSQEIVGRHISILIPPDLAFELPVLIDNLRRGARIERQESERVTKHGRRIFVSLTMSPIKDAAEYVVGASVIARDITERKLAEKALALSEERYRSLTLATSQIVWTMNPQGEMVGDLPMWCEFTGQSLEDAGGWGWLNALHPDDRERTAGIWSESLRNRSHYRSEFRLRRRDGEYRYMAVHGVAVLEQDATIREWVGTCADITEHVMAQEEVLKLNESLEKRVVERTAELQVANKELEAFAYSVSHDLRAPLRAVDGFSRILMEEYGPQLPAGAQHYLEVARNNAVQMGNLIDGLLHFSRLGRQPLRKQTVSPAVLVHQVLEDLRAEYDGRLVEITVGDLPSCEGDPLLLRQVFVNLLSNALKYTRERETARIEIASPESKVYCVRDNGVGFDMRYQDKLFGVFQRLHNSEDYEGTGVGLAIVQRIVHRHGGRVWADALVNQGATFYFTLGDNRASQREHPEDLSKIESAAEVNS